MRVIISIMAPVIGSTPQECIPLVLSRIPRGYTTIHRYLEARGFHLPLEGFPFYHSQWAHRFPIQPAGPSFRLKRP